MQNISGFEVVIGHRPHTKTPIRNKRTGAFLSSENYGVTVSRGGGVLTLS
ncbi:hypothetical protein L248_0877 [Schleiferilactobacillus shenzhenensis LY-73]|uniref:Uncharacterized protein n=1 Tax=Schleiferilactobacillus shenzhenensis LY-73 TaxID=1231336 RepID=U4TI38_9LACO|nr:hypothetical protein L248_0877 [Schleiferilactobacillus shenzhenensis LY-73]